VIIGTASIRQIDTIAITPPQNNNTCLLSPPRGPAAPVSFFASRSRGKRYRCVAELGQADRAPGEAGRIEVARASNDLRF
jgi:hypothetical protein